MYTDFFACSPACLKWLHFLSAGKLPPLNPYPFTGCVALGILNFSQLNFLMSVCSVLFVLLGDRVSCSPDCSWAFCRPKDDPVPLTSLPVALQCGDVRHVPVCPVYMKLGSLPWPCVCSHSQLSCVMHPQLLLHLTEAKAFRTVRSLMGTLLFELCPADKLSISANNKPYLSDFCLPF